MCDFKAGGNRARLAAAGRLDMAYKVVHDWNAAVESVAAELVAETGCDMACAKEYLGRLVPQNRQQVFVESQLSFGG